MSSKRVISVGSLNFDAVFACDRLPREHEKLRCEESWQQFGGSGANTAYWLARLGIPTQMFGRVGNDALGDMCLADLQSVGVDTSLVQRDKELSTGIAAVIAEGQAKRMLTGKNANAALELSYEFIAAVDANSHVHVSVSKDDIAIPILKKAKTQGASTSCDFNGTQHPERIQFSDYCLMNYDELRRWVGDEQPQQRWRELCGQAQPWLILTKAEQGAEAQRGFQVVHQATRIVDPLDRTGGGDAFNAGFLSQILNGADMPTALKCGLALAGEVIQIRGTRSLQVKIGS